MTTCFTLALALMAISPSTAKMVPPDSVQFLTPEFISNHLCDSFTVRSDGKGMFFSGHFWGMVDSGEYDLMRFHDDSLVMIRLVYDDCSIIDISCRVDSQDRIIRHDYISVFYLSQNRFYSFYEDSLFYREKDNQTVPSKVVGLKRSDVVEVEALTNSITLKMLAAIRRSETLRHPKKE